MAVHRLYHQGCQNHWAQRYQRLWERGSYSHFLFHKRWYLCFETREREQSKNCKKPKVAQTAKRDGFCEELQPSESLIKFMRQTFTLKSATKPLNVLIAFTRPLITEFADNLNLKHPLLPTISPYPTMWLEAIRSIIPISCRCYPKSVWKTSA